LYEQLADRARRNDARGEAVLGTPVIHTEIMECLEEQRDMNGAVHATDASLGVSSYPSLSAMEFYT
jgi:hypothetical protein